MRAACWAEGSSKVKRLQEGLSGVLVPLTPTLTAAEGGHCLLTAQQDIDSMSLFARGGHGLTEGRHGPAEGRWSAHRHTQAFFPCPCSPACAGPLCALLANGSHVHMCGTEANWNTDKERLCLSRKKPKSSKNLKCTMHIMKVNNISHVSWCHFQVLNKRCGLGERTHAWHGILVTSLQCLSGLPYEDPQARVSFMCFFDTEWCYVKLHVKLHIQLSLLWSLTLHPLL